MPRALEAYAAKVLFDEFAEGKRSKGRPAECIKNWAVVNALALLDANGIPPTRSQATSEEFECGSRIVAEIFTDAGMEIGETGVAKIWERHRKKILAFGNSASPNQK